MWMLNKNFNLNFELCILGVRKFEVKGDLSEVDYLVLEKLYKISKYQLVFWGMIVIVCSI